MNIINLALAPEITELPHKVNSVVGRLVTIECKHSGIPKPNVKWTRNNIELTGGRYSILDNGNLQIRLVFFVVKCLNVIFLFLDKAIVKILQYIYNMIRLLLYNDIVFFLCILNFFNWFLIFSNGIIN